MATTILNDKGWAGGLSELLGNAGNNAISSIINGKIQGMQQQQQKQQFMNQLQQGGYSQPEAQTAQLFQQNPKALLDYISRLGSSQDMNNQGSPLNPAQKLGHGFNAKQREAQSLAQQRVVTAQNKKFNETITPQITTASKTIDYIKEARDILGRGKTAGALRSTLPFYKLTQNEDTQDLDGVFNNIVGLMNESQRGIPTRYKIEFNKSLKPQVGEPRRVIEKKLQRLEKEAQKILKIAELRDQLIAENNYREPEGLEAKINALIKGEKKKSINEEVMPEKASNQALQASTLNNNQNSDESNPNFDQGNEESIPASLLRNLYRTIPAGLSSTLGGIGSLLQPSFDQFKQTSEQSGLYKNLPPEIAQLLQNQQIVPTVPQVRQSIQDLENQVLPKGYSTPQGDIEEFLDRIQQDSPFALIGGLPALASSVGGNVGAGIGKGIGGETGEAIGGVLGGLGAGALARGIRPKSIRETASKEASKFYGPAEKRASKIKQPATEFHKFLGDQIDKLSEGKSGLTDKAAKQVRHEFIKVANDITRNEINVLDAIKSKRHLNKLYQEHKGTEAGNYYKRATGAINEQVIQKAAQDHKLFGQQWNAAEDLFKSSVVRPDSWAEQFAETAKFKNVIKNPGLKKGLGYVLTKGLESSSKAFNTFWNHPATQRLARKALTALAHDNTGQLTNILGRLDKEADRNLKE